ncbi:polyprenol phosphomannose-dependent alpha 1,6 mannosyltransferase MptB [Kocuria nitroreducens]|uniref:polyprenol phosphomannose-dependent alpha 1,6 mannosyltransferase MptB n=1 Tax=Kocuria nitroreducens TaxID=3058914 RepID=UPI0036DA6451
MQTTSTTPGPGEGPGGVRPPAEPESSRYVSGSLRRTVLMGALGSVMLLVGSLGVGWLASVSPLRQAPVIIGMRFTTTGAIVSILLLAVGGMLLIREWLRLGQKLNRWGPGSGRWVLIAIAAWSAPMLVTIPLFSRDVYSYIGQGRVMANGLNPYEHGVSTIDNFFQLGADQMWSESPPPYGPLFLWLEQFVVAVTGADPDAAVLWFRGMCVLAVIACMWLIPRLARLHGINPARALWLSVANPLFLTNFIVSVHNDAIMIALALGGTYVAAVHRNWKGGLLGTTLVTLSVAVKPITLVFLPFIGLLWAGKHASWIRRLVIWLLVLAYSIALLGLMGLVNGFGFGWVSAMSTPGSVSIWYAPVGLVGMLATTLAGAVGADSGQWREVTHSVGQALAVPAILWLMFVGRDERIIRRLTWAFAAIVLFSPMIQAWYVVWLIPLFAVTGIRSDWQVDILFFLTVFFMIYAVSDQLDVFPYLDLDLSSGRLIAAVVALSYGVYLWFIDPATRRLFRGRYQPLVQSTVI